VGTGALCSALMWAGEAQIMHAFTHEPGVHAELRSAWSVLVLMQPCNAAVFVYDGLMLALQAFAFIRNLMLVTTLGMFGPALWLCYAAGVGGLGHTLLAIWLANCLLNAGRFVGAAWRVSWRG
jgi:Na+-driven multidrug efflux pump